MAYSAIDLARGSIGGGTKILLVVGYEGRLLLVHSLWNKSIALNWDMRRSLVENFVVGNSAAEIFVVVHSDRGCDGGWLDQNHDPTN